MTVRDWIVRRSSQSPGALTAEVLAAIGRDGQQPAARTGEVCLAAAARALDELVTHGRFDRTSAFALLGIDALTTFAYEHASEAAADERELRAVAQRGAETISRLALARV